jgi:hypothetical protein
MATAVRAEMGLQPHAPLDSRDLALHLEIPLHPLSGLTGNDMTEAIRHVNQNGKVLSAMTIFPDWPLRHRVIIFNDGNSDAVTTRDLRRTRRPGSRAV